MPAPEPAPPSTAARSVESFATRLPFFYGWIVVAVAFITLGVSVSVRTSFSLLFPPILDEFGWSRGTTAAAFSVGFFSSALLAPFIGTAMDRWGPRVVMPLGAVIVAAGLILATLATAPWHFYLTLGLLVVGFGIAIAFIGHGAFLPGWFTRRRGLAVGIAYSGVGIGALLLFPWLQAIIDGEGWRQACWALALLLLVLVVPLNLLLQRHRPADLGLRPDGDAAVEPDGQSGGIADDNVVDAAWAETEWTMARALRQPRFWWLLLGLGSGLWAWYAVQVHQTRYLLDVGFPAEQAAIALGLVGLLGIGGQVGLGYLSDRIGREWAWSLACLGFGLCYLLLLALRSYPQDGLLYLMVACQGLLGYGIAPLYATISAELFQGRNFGAVFGVISTGGTLGAAAGPWVSGLLYDGQGDYVLAFWLAAGLCLVSSLAIWQAAPRKVRLVSGQAARRRRPEAGKVSG